jgi:ABC-type uncharacterized transport system permease subunit
MVVGAFFAIWGSITFGHWSAGLACAIVMGVLFSMLHAVPAISYQADQIITGTALILIAAGFINFLNLTLFADKGSLANVSRVPEVSLGPLGGISLLVPVAGALVFAVYFVLFRTPWGLHLRAVGEHPKAADTVGINVFRTRYIAVAISGAFAGLAGAYLSFNVGNYSEGMVGGKGFIALAAVIFGKWNPVGALLASLLFGFAQALGDTIQANELPVPSEVVTALPYVITLVALAGFIGKSVAPAAVGKPYAKG